MLGMQCGKMEGAVLQAFYYSCQSRRFAVICKHLGRHGEFAPEGGHLILHNRASDNKRQKNSKKQIQQNRIYNPLPSQRPYFDQHKQSNKPAPQRLPLTQSRREARDVCRVRIQIVALPPAPLLASPPFPFQEPTNISPHCYSELEAGG